MKEVLISRLHPDEWPGYKALRLEALRTEPQAFSSTYTTNAQHPDAFWRGRLAAVGSSSWLLFAKTQGRLVGMIGAFVEDQPDLADIVSVYVTPEFRQRGISKLLMAAILDELRQTVVIKTARLGVNGTQRAAVRLYESFGFQPIGVENLLMGDGQWYDEMLMEKPLF